MKSYIQFVTVPTGDTPGTCVVLHYDNRRYLFGHVAEGTMRACNELNTSLRKVQKIFITGRTNRETTGGLLGTLLTLADANGSAQESHKQQSTKGAKTPASQDNDEVNVYGPPNLVHSVAAARKFIFRKSTPTTIQDFGDTSSERNEQGDWLPRVLDSNVDVFALVVKPHISDDTASSIQQDPDSEAKDLIRNRVINDMFNSKWRLDTLVETSLGDVKLPAKMWVRNYDTKDLELYTGPLPSDPMANKFLKVLVRNPWPASMVSRLPATDRKDEVVSYVVRGRMTRGKFKVEKAKALKVPAGPLYSKLANGESVQLKDGRTVRSDEVVGPDIQTGGFAILDVPSMEYVEPLLAREEFDAEQVMAGVETFVWLLGPGVSSNAKLQQFIKDKPQIQHVISSLDHNVNALVAHGAAESAIKLAQIDTDHFPIPYYDNVTKPAPSFRRECGFLPQKAGQQGQLFSLPNVQLAQRGLAVQIDPKRVLDEHFTVQPLDTLNLITTSRSKEVMELANEAKQAAIEGPLQQELKEWHARVPTQDAEIITLGTGSAIPSRYRNVSATLVRVPGWGSYLLDAGENTLGQLQRVFNPRELVEVLKDLRMIWISHGHADHHLGTVSMIKAWYDVVHGHNTEYPPITPQVAEILLEEYSKDTPTAQTTPISADKRPKYLAVMGNRFLIDYLDEISLVEDFGYSYVLPIVPQGHAVQAANQPNAVFPSVQIVLTRPSVSSPISDQSGTENSSMWVSRALGPGQRMGLLGLGKATSVNVEHCNGARALCLKWPQGKGDPSPFSVAYSGDCRPSSAFAKAARGATVLIHEATFDDELKGEAKAKKHSTVQEAVGVASLMRAKSLVLTHFSQRYQKIPVLDHVWEKTDDLEREIEREERDLDVHGRAAKGLGAGQDVDEIAPDLDEATGTTTDPQNLEPMEKMDEDNDGEAETEAEVGAKETPLKILFAFDYMRVRVGEIPKLQAYRPALMKLFENEIEESEAKRLKKSLSLADMTPFNGGVGLGGTKMAKQKPGNTPGGPKRHGSVKKGQENGKAKKRKSVGSAEAARAAIDKTGAGKNSDALDGLADGIHEMV